MTINSNAEEYEIVQNYGLYGQYLYNYHTTDFTNLREIPDLSSSFSSGFGKGLAFGLSYELPLPYSLTLGLRAGISKLDGDFSAIEPAGIFFNNIDTAGFSNHTMTMNLMDFGFEPYMSWCIFDEFKIHFGGRLSFLVSSSYEQKEEIINSPEGAVFSDTKETTRNVNSGSMGDTAVKGSYGNIFFGASYGIPLNSSGSVSLVPELFYNIGLTSFLPKNEWIVSSFRFGLSLVYSQREKKPELPKEVRRRYNLDTVKILSEDLKGYRYVKGIEDIKTTEEELPYSILVTNTIKRTDTIFSRPMPNAVITPSDSRIILESRLVTEAFPLLPVVFFAQGSSEIHDEYLRAAETVNFSTDSIIANPLAYHYNIFNIIASRLKTHPSVKITLYGMADRNTESDSEILAAQRSKAVRDFLIKRYGFEEKRIIIAQQGTKGGFFPAATTTQSEKGHSENRRVEIYSDNSEIIAPVIKKSFTENAGISPDSVIINTQGSTRKGVAAWTLLARQNDRTLLKESGNENKFKITAHLSGNVLSDLIAGIPLTFEYFIEDIDGNTASGRARAEVITGNVRQSIERMSVILFGVGSDEPSPAAAAFLRDFIKKAGNISKLRISGFTDNLGSEQENGRLSEARALAVARMIKKINPKIEIIGAEGIASKDFPRGIKSYNTPAERFLSRTVQIELLK